MGPLPVFLQEEFQKNPRFIGLKFPDVTKPETIDKRYVGKMSLEELDLMAGLLEMDPTKRLTAYEALMHPYFDDIRDSELEQQFERIGL
jgi:cyclin-dependent kinase-like